MEGATSSNNWLPHQFVDKILSTTGESEVTDVRLFEVSQETNVTRDMLNQLAKVNLSDQSL